MKRTVITVLLATLGLMLCGQDILNEVDRRISYADRDFSGEYTVTRHVPNKGASVEKIAMFRRDDDDKFTILFLAPEARAGKGYLKIGNNMWIYDPDSNRFNVTSARDRFQDSTIRNSDFEPSTLADDYRIVSRRQEALGAYETQVLDLEAVNSTVTFQRRKIWVDENYLIRKVEDYTLSGELLRTFVIPQYQKLEDKYVPISIVFVDALRGAMVNNRFQNERTVITVAKPSFDVLPDLVFTQSFLQRVGNE